MQRLGVSGAVRPIYGSLGFKRLMTYSQMLTMYPIIYQVNPVQNFTLCAFQGQFLYYTNIYV